MQNQLTDLSVLLGVTFSRLSLLEEALTHRSYLQEFPYSESGDYERLEYLGDAVLDLAMSHILMEQFKEISAGELSKIRAAAVNQKTLANLARRLDLGAYIHLSHGEESTAGREKSSILADILEAIIGAIYLDAGYERALLFVREQFRDMFENPESLLIYDYKTRLQEFTQAEYRETPHYRMLAATGPDHDKRFEVEVSIGGEVKGRGQGRTKKDADQAAARDAFISIKGSDPLDNRPFFPVEEDQ